MEVRELIRTSVAQEPRSTRLASCRLRSLTVSDGARVSITEAGEPAISRATVAQVCNVGGVTVNGLNTKTVTGALVGKYPLCLGDDGALQAAVATKAIPRLYRYRLSMLDPGTEAWQVTTSPQDTSIPQGNTLELTQAGCPSPCSRIPTSQGVTCGYDETDKEWLLWLLVAIGIAAGLGVLGWVFVFLKSGPRKLRR